MDLLGLARCGIPTSNLRYDGLPAVRLQPGREELHLVHRTDQSAWHQTGKDLKGSLLDYAFTGRAGSVTVEVLVNVDDELGLVG